MYERNVLKKLKKELSRHWNSAWGDVGIFKHYSYAKDSYFCEKEKSHYECPTTVGNYRTFRVYQSYVPLVWNTMIKKNSSMLLTL